MDHPIATASFLLTTNLIRSLILEGILAREQALGFYDKLVADLEPCTDELRAMTPKQFFIARWKHTTQEELDYFNSSELSFQFVPREEGNDDYLVTAGEDGKPTRGEIEVEREGDRWFVAEF